MKLTPHAVTARLLRHRARLDRVASSLTTEEISEAETLLHRAERAYLDRGPRSRWRLYYMASVAIVTDALRAIARGKRPEQAKRRKRTGGLYRPASDADLALVLRNVAWAVQRLERAVAHVDRNLAQQVITFCEGMQLNVPRIAERGAWFLRTAAVEL
ncbi:MAG TPA: hypothetical protein VNJ51_03140, partial [Candidatus Dormibacteraeota bacterium]|nr:hypothetical protein [Candidatus Dormibacteraeota bacterium]